MRKPIPQTLFMAALGAFDVVASITSPVQWMSQLEAGCAGFIFCCAAVMWMLWLDYRREMRELERHFAA